MSVYHLNLRMWKLVGILFFGGAAFMARGENNVSPAREYVQRIDVGRLQAGYDALPRRDRELVRLYLKNAPRYVLTDPDGAFPHPGTEHWRNIAERAHGAAVLAAVPSDWPAELKERCRSESAAWVKEFTAQYKLKPEMGNAWQCSWWVGEMGMAAWFVWDRLDAGLQNDVAAMVAFHADRIAGKMPGAHVEKDTEAETVSWNSQVLSLAVNMMPTHPHHAKWQEAAKRYVYTIFGTDSDKTDHTPGDDGKAVKDWVVGANIHNDFSLENHNRFHMEYIYASYRFMMEGAAMYRVGGNEVPKAFSHHIAEVHEKVICQCMNGSKFAIFVSDNDWKRYHLWTESPAVHGYVALLTASPLASALEEESLNAASEYWGKFPANFEYPNQYVCGKPWTPRIADIVLLHLLSPREVKPMEELEVEDKLAGARQKQDVDLLSQYSKAGSFRSFFWGPGPVVRQVEPKDNAWMMLPLSSNYRAAINGKLSSDIGAKTFSGKGADWFWVMRIYTNGAAEAFVSLPDEMVLTMNYMPAAALKGAKTVDGFVAVEKPDQTFTAYFEGEKAKYRYGKTNWQRSDKVGGLELKSAWLNLADSMGFVTLDFSEGSSGMILPPPGARGSMSVYHQANPTREVAFMTAIFPNQDHSSTKDMVREIGGTYRDGVMSFEGEGYRISANFSDKASESQRISGHAVTIQKRQ